MLRAWFQLFFFPEGIPTTEFLNVWVKKDNDTDGAEIEDPISPTKPPFANTKFSMIQLKNKNATKLIPYNKTGLEFAFRNVQCIPQPGKYVNDFAFLV